MRRITAEENKKNQWRFSRLQDFEHGTIMRRTIVHGEMKFPTDES